MDPATNRVRGKPLICLLRGLWIFNKGTNSSGFILSFFRCSAWGGAPWEFFLREIEAAAPTFCPADSKGARGLPLSPQRWPWMRKPLVPKACCQLCYSVSQDLHRSSLSARAKALHHSEKVLQRLINTTTWVQSPAKLLPAVM